MSRSTSPPAKPDAETVTKHVQEHREIFEECAERDDKAGAIARVFLKIADGEPLDEQECEAAGLPTLYQLSEQN